MSERNELTLATGRLIRLVAIDQWGTYDGLLGGLPTRESNERRMKEALERAMQRWHFESFLIRPVETVIHIGRPYPFGTPASIPGITCMACLECSETARNHLMDGSTLPIVWFQDEFAFPIDPNIQLQLQSLDWEQQASDFQY